MALDKQLEIALRDAVQDEGQSHGVAEKLIKWLENSLDGSENPLEEGVYSRYLDLIYSEMTIKEED